MLDFSDPLLVGTLLQRLLSPVTGVYAGLSMEGGMGIEHSNVKICFFKSSSPETIGCDVETSAILSI